MIVTKLLSVIFINCSRVGNRWWCECGNRDVIYLNKAIETLWTCTEQLPKTPYHCGSMRKHHSNLLKRMCCCTSILQFTEWHQWSISN